MKTHKYFFKKNHPWHIVTPIQYSYTVLISFALFCSLTSLVLFIFHPSFILNIVSKDTFLYYFLSKIALVMPFTVIVLLFLWLLNVKNDSLDNKILNNSVAHNFTLGIILFIITEVMLFFSFFWAFFNSSLNPSIWVGAVWPPVGISVLNPWAIPLANTVILLVSGVTINAFYYTLVYTIPNVEYISQKVIPHKDLNICVSRYTKAFSIIFKSIRLTLFLGFIFLLFQVYEYMHATFSISDSIYGTVFYSLTGLHGFHVFVGLVLILICYIRLRYTVDFLKYISPYVGLTSAVWYWHFVDVVWLFLYVIVYHS